MRLLPVILAISLVAGAGAATRTHHHASSAATGGGNSCTGTADRSAFDIEALKSELMVTALACHQQDKYNAFMRTYQPTVAREEGDLHTYFKRAYGKLNQKAYDDYISNLANVQEQDGLKAGTAFCDNLPTMFDEVMSLHDGTELLDYAHSQPLVQPVDFVTCGTEPLVAPTTHRTRHRRT